MGKSFWIFRTEFIRQLLTLGVRHKPSSAYLPQNNSLAERAVQSLKNCLQKSSSRFTKLHLDEMTFAINSTASQEGTGSVNDSFLGKSVRSKMPNSVNPEIESSNLIKRRIEKHDNRIKETNKTNKILYKVGDRVMLQNIANKGRGFFLFDKSFFNASPNI